MRESVLKGGERVLGSQPSVALIGQFGCGARVPHGTLAICIQNFLIRYHTSPGNDNFTYFYKKKNDNFTYVR